MAEVESVWRCAGCGKWSTAKRRPKEHERFVPSNTPIPSGYRVLRVVKDEPIAEDDFREGGTFIACGPFEEWVAVRAR